MRAIGAGDVSLSRSAARGVDSHDLSRAVHATFEAGIDVVDIAPEEDSERLVGEVIRALHLRDRALPITRVPALVPTTSEGWTTRDPLREQLPHRYLQERIERSLRATRLDALPVVMIELRAAWRESPVWPELVDACARLVRDGKVLAYGAYIDQIEEDSTALLDETWLDAVNVPYSLCERAAERVIARVLELRVRPSDEAAGATGGPSGSGVARETSDERDRNAATRDRASPQSPSTESLANADPALAAAAASDPNIAAVLASSLTGVSDSGLLTGVNSSSSSRTGVSFLDPKMAAKDPVVAAALARDPKLAAALGIELPRRDGARDVAILVRRPLAGGALAGTLGPGVKLRKDDDRKLDARTLERIAVAVAKLAAYVKETPPAARSCDAAKLQLERNEKREDVECVTLAELALRFAIDRGTMPLVRLQHRDHIVDALAAMVARPLSRELTPNLDI
ncbi:MAG TPA: aldo/keto reductase [Kofleriaceae bacterium]|nr:aldo/keto reductase [Kofleriaceae bacterium]